MSKNRILIPGVSLVVVMFVVTLLVTLLFTMTAEARLGGGGSFGSRGSRGFSNSRPYSPSYGSNPYRQAVPPPVSAAPQPIMAPGGGGFFRGMMGGMAGGFLGSMLFRQMGWGGGMGDGAGAGGVGMLEILLLAGLGFFLFRRVLTRSGSIAAPIYGMGQTQIQPQTEPQQQQAGIRDEASSADVLRRFDSGFDLRRFKDTLTDGFFGVQSAWSRRDLAPVRPLMTPEIYQELDRQLAQMRGDGRINHLENIAVREIEVLEAWQELGKEYATVRFYANLLDYLVDEKTGQVVEGSNTVPVKFEELWTYARDVGTRSAWQLAAVEQAGA